MVEKTQRPDGKGKDFVSPTKARKGWTFWWLWTSGDVIKELKINYAKGYRVYLKETDGKIIILLIGGDKSTQQKDIEKAKSIWKKIKK